MKSPLKRIAAVSAVAVGLGFASPGAHAVAFTTFVSSTDINTAVGQTNTIAFNYAGNKFVGSVYFGPNNLQLYQTNLNGGGVTTFGSPLPTGSGEVVIGVSLGQAGFGKGDIYASGDANIYQYANGGGAPSLFGSIPAGGGTSRQIFFDPGSTFGGEMLVTTTSGNVYRFDSGGNPTFVANVGEDAEGMDIAPAGFGSFGGDLLVASEGSGSIRAVSPGGIVTFITTISAAETVSTIPLNLGASGNPIEGFYVANYPVDVQVAGASEFAGLQGDVVVTSEFGSSSPLSLIHFDGTQFVVSQIGTIPNQSEDGIFVTAARITGTTPEPATLALLGLGLAGIAFWRRARKD